MQIVKPSTIAGVMELLPEDQLVFDNIKSTIEETFKKYQFLPLDTPLIEKNEILFAKGGGETEKQIYSIDSTSKDMSLRFDLTVPLARYVAEHFSDLNFPFKRYHIGKVYRGERNQKGRYKEFYQCDIDIIGNGSLSIYNDALLPKVIFEIFKKLEFNDIVFHINNRKLLNGYFKSLGIEDSTEILRTVDKLAKIGKEETVKLLEKEVDLESAQKIVDFLTRDFTNKELLEDLRNNESNDLYNEGLKELESVYDYMLKFEIPDENIKIDLSITRGLDYYTSTVYETFLTGFESLGSVCSGGRYENLASNFSKQSLPGVGLSIGLTRLFYQLKQIGYVDKHKNALTEVLVIPMDEEFDFYAIELVNFLRKNGISVDIYLESGKFKKKLTYADKLNIKNVIIIGEEEFKENKLTLKNMEDGSQELLGFEEVLEKFKR